MEFYNSPLEGDFDTQPPTWGLRKPGNRETRDLQTMNCLHWICSRGESRSNFPGGQLFPVLGGKNTDSPGWWLMSKSSFMIRTCQWGWCIRPKKSHIFFFGLFSKMQLKIRIKIDVWQFPCLSIFIQWPLYSVAVFLELEWAELRFCHGFPESGLPTCIILHWAIIRDDGTAEPVFEIHPETFEKRHEILKMQPFTFESYQPPLLNAPSIRLLFDPFKRKNTWQLVCLCRGCHLILEFFRWAPPFLGPTKRSRKGP